MSGRGDPAGASRPDARPRASAGPLPRSVVALSGGVGGARLADGLARALPDGALTVVVNTGDDFVHWGLHVSPDVDTVVYTLAGLADEAQGWGLAGDTFNALASVERYDGPAWFRLGDGDLATHLLRTTWTAEGRSLTEVTARLAGALGVAQRVLPMADGPRPTLVHTEADGTLPFQEWFVGRRARPRVTDISFGGAPTPAPGVLEAIDAADVVVIGPSNPYVSIDPILALDGVRDALARRPVVAVSPIVGGRAVKGPLAEMIPSLAGEPASAGAVARHYRGLLSALVVECGDEVDEVDEGDSSEGGDWGGGVRRVGTRTVMAGGDDRERLAREVLAVAGELL